MYEITIYEDSKGFSPVEMFLDDVNMDDSKVKRFFFILEQLKSNGTRLGKPQVKFIEDKLYEIRMDNHRVLFMVRGNELILLHHFLKKTKKTPRSEISKAKREYQDWISRGY